MKQKVLQLQGVSPFPGSPVKWKDKVCKRKGLPANEPGKRELLK